MELINIITLWLHYLATVMWIGGMAFNLLVLRPSMIVIDQNQRPVLGTTVLKRFHHFCLVKHRIADPYRHFNCRKPWSF